MLHTGVYIIDFFSNRLSLIPRQLCCSVLQCVAVCCSVLQFMNTDNQKRLHTGAFPPRLCGLLRQLCGTVFCNFIYTYIYAKAAAYRGLHDLYFFFKLPLRLTAAAVLQRVLQFLIYIYMCIYSKASAHQTYIIHLFYTWPLAAIAAAVMQCVAVYIHI